MRTEYEIKIEAKLELLQDLLKIYQVKKEKDLTKWVRWLLREYKQLNSNQK